MASVIVGLDVAPGKVKGGDRGATALWAREPGDLFLGRVRIQLADILGLEPGWSGQGAVGMVLGGSRQSYGRWKRPVSAGSTSAEPGKALSPQTPS